ncbi:hypothetical protein BOTBODRAFT_347968 [Botryobasidium botryosum FD-172 SS1]|uniref:Uncharacterized protein n=1 Tax=Botryobasidium botryosum (strain FD-172 SS1) TaxID=930990 RepID=A0A067MEU1_BOTB1|nr:hypothetical protein BOTBODRAFT_347968 [Botryobasidium botryosum FD-172 SS1]
MLVFLHLSAFISASFITHSPRVLPRPFRFIHSNSHTRSVQRSGIVIGPLGSFPLILHHVYYIPKLKLQIRCLFIDRLRTFPGPI